MHACTWARACSPATALCVEVRRQFAGTSSLLPCGYCRLNLGCRVWQNALYLLSGLAGPSGFHLETLDFTQEDVMEDTPSRMLRKEREPWNHYVQEQMEAMSYHSHFFYLEYEQKTLQPNRSTLSALAQLPGSASDHSSPPKATWACHEAPSAPRVSCLFTHIHLLTTWENSVLKTEFASGPAPHPGKN